MIDALFLKLIFVPFSAYDLLYSSTPRPFSLLEISIIAWGCCFIAGWYFTCLRVERLYMLEGITAAAASDKSTCFRDKKESSSIAWMLEVNSRGTFFFKSLYWFSYGFVHSIFIFLVLLALVYSYMIFSNKDPDSQWSRKGNVDAIPWDGATIGDGASKDVELKLPAIFGMQGIFAIFDVRFILMHVVVFAVSFLSFYACCLIFLKKEDVNAEDKRVALVNRQRFKFLLYSSYVFVDTCYMVFEFVMQFSIEAPSQLTAALDDWKKEKIIKWFEEHSGSLLQIDSDLKNKISEDESHMYQHFKEWVLGQTRLTTTKELINLVRSLPNRRDFCGQILSMFMHENSNVHHVV